MTTVDGPPRAATTRVFILDDHELVRRGLVDLLGSAPDLEVVGEAATAGQALRRIPAVLPDVAVLDARLPDGSGIEVCRTIRSDHPGVRCLILTSYDDDEALYAAVLAGASGYLLKDIVGSSLVEDIRHVARGRSLLDPALTSKLMERLLQPPQDDPMVAGLTPREQDVLALIAEGQTNRQIGEQLGLAEKTVKNYVTGILMKLGMQRRTQAAVFGSKVRRSAKPPV
ncbi:response regulator [Microlunatus antarcticus]|uniref:DNA-binding NarL/FixJ family response regulator n=1 Tax=Microlunatus antarcticus TaxID=53388 RepID=A0A7W5P784_9ACTN|nr:response regulator transcription factor [Microlunatus antarcticus]MBB3327233.1 DNA-binding NarL/FixJ family response regulator [Microlunatus antarcticus]